MKALLACLGAALMVVAVAGEASAQTVSRAYTKFNSKACKHTPGRFDEDYGSWRCAGYQGIDVVLSAGDQRMQVSFGRKAGDRMAAEQTFPGFNHVYEGTVEWRIETLPNGKTRPFATILRWFVWQDGDEARRRATGQVLVVTRLGPGEMCHVGYVDARANAGNANDLAAQIADQHARTFDCEKDKPIVLGNHVPGMMPAKE